MSEDSFYRPASAPLKPTTAADGGRCPTCDRLTASGPVIEATQLRRMIELACYRRVRDGKDGKPTIAITGDDIDDEALDDPVPTAYCASCGKAVSNYDTYVFREGLIEHRNCAKPRDGGLADG